MSKPNKKLVLIDGMAVLHRAYHAYPLSLSTKAGELTNAVYGFTTIMLTGLEKIRPTHVVVAWDVGKPTFRHEQFTDYKVNRVKPDEELLGQIERTQQVVETLNIPQFGVEGFEADDVIGTISKQAIDENGTQVVIVTGDRDALQLVDDEKIIVYMPPAPGKFGKDHGPQIYDEVAVKAKYGISPLQVIELKALMGDASDDIPGVKGVGQVTATKLITRFETVDKLYEFLDSGDADPVLTPRIIQLLKADREKAFLSKSLATIMREVPISLDWEKCKLADYNREKVLELFDELQFRSLINKLPKDIWEEDMEEVFK